MSSSDVISIMSASATKSRYQFNSVAASPGVSLERGNYRMRAPNLRPLPTLFQGQTTLAPRSSRRQHRINPHLVMLIILLGVGCLSCFITAYYLFSTRWATYTRQTSSSTNSENQVSVFEDFACSFNASVKYLTYLPHSGFHNQRIAFENALVLAHALHRTLLVPPIRLGNKPIRYVEFNKLLQYIEMSDKLGLKHCPQIPRYLSRSPECLHYFDSAHVPWTWLVDLSPLTAHQALCHIPTMSRSWIAQTFGINVSDVHNLKDSFPYQFRFVDSNGTSRTGGKYHEDVIIDHLSKTRAKLLQIGTLFGTSRIQLEHPHNLAYRDLVRRSMVFGNKELSDVAASIASGLGKCYIALHIRSGDGIFQSKANETVKTIWWRTLHDIIGLPDTEICHLEKILGTEPSSRCSDTRNTSLEIARSFFNSAHVGDCSFPLLKCPGTKYDLKKYDFLNNPLYIATDLPTPHVNPLLSVIRKTFPCTFFLEDFEAQLLPLRNLNSTYDTVNMYEFSLPFIDALVASRALRVVGTEGSTFSKFVVDILWKVFHGGA